MIDEVFLCDDYRPLFLVGLLCIAFGLFLRTVASDVVDVPEKGRRFFRLSSMCISEGVHLVVPISSPSLSTTLS